MSKPSNLDESIEIIKGLLYAEEDWNDRAEAFLAKVRQPSPAATPAATRPDPNWAGATCPDCGAKFAEGGPRPAALCLASHVRFSVQPHPKARAAGLR